MTVLVTNYTLDATAKTVTFNDYVTIDLANVIAIVDVTTDVQIYIPQRHTPIDLGGTVSGNVFTYTNSSEFIADSDVLRVWYNDPTGSGGGGTPIYEVGVIISTPYNATQTSGDVILLVDTIAAGGDVTINLPTAVDNLAKFTIKKIDSGVDIVIIDADGTEEIDEDLNKEILFQNTSITIISDNSNWWRID